MSTRIDPAIMALITQAAQRPGTNIGTQTGSLTGQTTGDVFTWNQPSLSTPLGQYGTLSQNLGANAINNKLSNPTYNSPSTSSLQSLTPGQSKIQTSLSSYNPLTPTSMQGIPSSITAAKINPIGSTWTGTPATPGLPGYPVGYQGVGSPWTNTGINMQPYAQSILDYFNQGTLPPQLQAIQNQVQRAQQIEAQQLEQSLAVRGLNQSTLGDAERQQLAAKHRDEMTTAMTSAANSMLTTQTNVLGQLSASQLAAQNQAFQQGLSAQQQGTAEQAQLFGQGITQRETALNELTTLGGAQEQLLNDAYTQALAAQNQGYNQAMGISAFQQGQASDLFNQTQAARQGSLNEFLSLLNAQQGLDTSSFNQSNAAIAQLLQAMGIAATPANVPSYTVPNVQQTSTAQAGGNLMGNILTSVLSNPNYASMWGG